MNGQIAKLAGLINIGFYLLLFSPVKSHSAGIFQTGIKSWFNSAEGSMETETASIKKTRQNAITNAISEVSPAVVCISLSSLARQEEQSYNEYFSVIEEKDAVTKVGSGFVINKEGEIVTNAHILDSSARQIIVSLNTGVSYTARLIGVDSVADVALLSIVSGESDSFEAVEIGNSKDVMVGEWSIAMGNPFGLMESGNPTVSVGVISARNINFQPETTSFRAYMDMIQTDALIEHGNSGGPLINSAGEVIGMNTYISTHVTNAEDDSRGNRYAIPINRVMDIVEVLKAEDQMNLSFDPGFDFRMVSPELAQKYNLGSGNGLLVTSVNKNGPAYESGIMPGDIIIKLDNIHVQSVTHAYGLLRNYQIGDRVQIELIRDRKKYLTTMVLRAKIEQANTQK